MKSISTIGVLVLLTSCTTSSKKQTNTMENSDNRVVKVELVSTESSMEMDDPVPGESEKHQFVITNNKWGIRDLQGKMVIEPIYDHATMFLEGLSTVRLGNKFGLVDEQGNFVLPLREMRSLGRVHDGLASFCMDKKYGFLNNKGQQKIKPQFEWAAMFSEGLCLVKNDTGLYGYINTEGQLVIPYQFKLAYNFLNGHANVNLKGVVGKIDKKGNFVAKEG